jgi:hypothetical protein
VDVNPGDIVLAVNQQPLQNQKQLSVQVLGHMIRRQVPPTRLFVLLIHSTTYR